VGDDGEEAVLVGHIDTKTPEKKLKEGLELCRIGKSNVGSIILQTHDLRLLT
jgi:hypothetical protein